MSTSPQSSLDFIQSVFDRRSFTRLFGAAGAIMLTRCGEDAAASATTARASAAGSGACVLAPELTIGPYFVDEKLNRSDLTTNTDNPNVLNGVPLTLNIYIMEYSST